MRLTFTLLFVFVLLVCKATLWLLVLKQGVAATMNATQMKSVTLHLAVAFLEKNVKHCVIPEIVLERLIALPKTIGRPVPADSL